MKKKLNCILLIDDDPDDNFFHQRIIKKMEITNAIHVARNGIEALDYLKDEKQVIPELIFLDINMPRMNGWEFLEQYQHLDEKQKARITIMMLTTSANPDDVKRANEIKDVTGIKTKPLSIEMLNEILAQHFNDYF
ncbi:MAG: response regulator [Bacteroidota bacterium]|nr:response regulator [Bacteroidota bacterium]